MLGCSRGRPNIMIATSATMPRVVNAVAASAWAMTRQAATKVRSPEGATWPTAEGTCCKKMMVAIPRVNPSMTGQG